MSAARSWKFIDGMLLMALVALAVGAARGPWSDVVGTALHDDEESHILLGLPIALWLAWVRRDRIRFLPPRRTLWGPAVVLAGWLCSWEGFRTGVDVMWHGGALLMAFGAILTVVGWEFVYEFLPAFGALLFLLPVPGRVRHAIALPLQEASARVTEFFLVLFGVPVERAGNELTIHGQVVGIAEACNGMRMVTALGLVAFAFVFTVPMRWSVRLVILLLTPAVALLANVIRLVPSTLLYGYADRHVAEAFHDLSGWGVLLLSLGILYGILSLLRWIEVPIAPYAVAED